MVHRIKISLGGPCPKETEEGVAPLVFVFSRSSIVLVLLPSDSLSVSLGSIWHRRVLFCLYLYTWDSEVVSRVISFSRVLLLFSARLMISLLSPSTQCRSSLWYDVTWRRQQVDEGAQRLGRESPTSGQSSVNAHVAHRRLLALALYVRFLVSTPVVPWVPHYCRGRGILLFLGHSTDI